MKLAVCVKHVPAGHLRFDEGPRLLDRSGPGELNSSDKNAIEEALRVKERDGGEVVVVTMGPEAATESLRTALGMGADRAVLVSDPAARGADLVGTSKVLAAALAREAADVVLFGQQTSDGGGALLWAAVAELLGAPCVSQATSIALAGAGLRVARETESGTDVVEVSLPALVAVSDAINEPRYTSLKGMMAAKKKPLDVLALGDLGLSAGDVAPLTTVLRFGPPPARANSVTVDDEAGAAQAIVEFLADKQLL
jgi:electron transfer flavoprotein beta subunit